MSVTVNQLLANAREKLERISPEQAFAEQQDGALIVDIRPQAQRERSGEVPGALVIERNVLEWRFDPTCDAKVAEAIHHDVRILVLCQEGYTSSLAAAALQEIGLRNATDIVGGLRAWREAGLPVTAGGTEPGDRVSQPA